MVLGLGGGVCCNCTPLLSSSPHPLTEMHPKHHHHHHRTRAACAADRPASVQLFLHVTTSVQRTADCALEALIAASGAGAANALNAVLSSRQLVQHMEW